MSRRVPFAIVAVVLLGCHAEREPIMSLADDAAVEAAAVQGGFRIVSFPSEDPGPPFYTRVSTLLGQIFHDDHYVAIPFYRDPACVPTDFNLLDAFHFPGPGGPGAFGCPLLVNGRLLIEPDAPLGTFPMQVITKGPAQVWFAPWPAFEQIATDGVVTLADLMALEPLRGTADAFHEMLAPRMEDHRVVITSHGRLEDGRRFQFNVTHLGDMTHSLLIRIR